MALKTIGLEACPARVSPDAHCRTDHDIDNPMRLSPQSGPPSRTSGRVRATDITGTLTDAGISLASVLVAMLRRDYSKDTAAQKSQLKTHLTALFSFITGGIAGLLLFRWIGFNAMLALGLMLAVVAIVSIITLSPLVRRVCASQ